MRNHYGVKGQKWGVRRSSEQLGHTNPKQLSDYMRNNIRYSEFKRLMSHDDVAKTKKGSCHDQVMFELEELRKMGKKPKAMFLINYNPKTNQGGKTHSFVYYKEKDKINWLENAWGGNEGIHQFDNVSSMAKTIKSMQKSKKYPEIQFANFDDHKHKRGESLQELVDICLEEPIDDFKIDQ